MLSKRQVLACAERTFNGIEAMTQNKIPHQARLEVSGVSKYTVPGCQYSEVDSDNSGLNTTCSVNLSFLLFRLGCRW
jgi:hypothetical protein